MPRPVCCRREHTGLSEWAVNFRRNSDAFNRNSDALNPSFRRKPESILRGATAHRPNHLRRADILSVIPASSTRHSGASRNLSCGERRLTGQTTYYGVRTFYPSFRRPQPVIPAQAGIWPAGSDGSPAKPPTACGHFTRHSDALNPVIPAQAGIYPAGSDGPPAKPPTACGHFIRHSSILNPSFRRKPESILRRATVNRPNHLLRRADILPVIPASSTRHSGASRNLSCGERRLTGQTTYYGVRTFYPSFQHPQPVIPAQAGIYPAESDG